MPKQDLAKGQDRASWWLHWRWAIAVMVVLGMIGSAMARYTHEPLQTMEVSGTYAPSVPWSLRGPALYPRSITVDPTGWLTVRTALGTEQKTRWWWDAAEGWIRCDLPELDRRIRGYRGWTGAVLYFRCAEALNRPEEIRMRRIH